MKRIVLIMIIYIVSVVIPIQSGEIAYTYDYDNFDEIFPQTRGVIDDFHLFKYEDIDTEYNGTNIGGAFLVLGTSHPQTPKYKGYVVDVTATFYCGSTYYEDEDYSLQIFVFYDGPELDDTYLCKERGWHYNYTWIPQQRDLSQNFAVRVQAQHVTMNRPYGFDMLRITTSSEKPPQLLQRDNNTSSNDP